MTLSDAAQRIIALSKAILEYWDIELPKRHPDYPIVNPGEDSGPPPKEAKELHDMLQALSEEEIYKLILLMHLGRGDLEVSDLDEELRRTKERFRQRETAIAHLEGKVSLAEYLSDGLNAIGKSGVDLDRLVPAST